MHCTATASPLSPYKIWQNSGFSQGECERSERSPEVTKTKVSANVVKRTACFCEENPRQRIFGRVKSKNKTSFCGFSEE